MHIEPLIERYHALWSCWRAPADGGPVDWAGAGIWDSEAEICINNHYSLSHLMLAAGLLYELTGKEDYRVQHDAMADLLQQHYVSGYAHYDVNTIHWDFNNHAWLSCAQLATGGDLAPRIRSGALQGLRRENGTWAGNWLVMRELNQALRRSLGISWQPWRRWPERFLQHRLFRRDGGIDEFPGHSRPVQYHAYILALLLRRFLVTQHFAPRDLRRMESGVAYLLAHLDPLGNANYRGRGQYQLFFEGCARYVLQIMSAWCGETDLGQACRDGLTCLDRQEWPVREGGLLSLVRTDPAGDRHGAYYDYHYLTVYNAFDLAWRLLALHDSKKIIRDSYPHRSRSAQRTGLFPDSGLYLARPAGWIFALTGGEDMYLSDVGLTVCHLGGRHGHLFTAPGGPHPGRYGVKYGSEQLRENVFSPLIWDGRELSLPHFRCGSLEETPDGVLARISRGDWRLQRRLGVRGNQLRFSDLLEAPRDVKIRRLFNWAMPVGLRLSRHSNQDYSIVSETGRLMARLHFNDPNVGELREGAPFRGPGGPVRPVYLPARGVVDRITFNLELEE